MTRNQIDYWRLQEDKRHQRAEERETERAHRRESSDRRLASYLEHKARMASNNINALHFNRQDAENSRHNIATEYQTAQANARELARVKLGYDTLSSQQEIAKISAGVGYAQVGANYANIAEMQRANMAQEALRQNQLNEELRSHIAQEAINRMNATSNQTRANTERSKQQFELGKWSSIGYDQALANLTQTRANTLQSWATTDKIKRETSLAGVNAASNLIGSGAQVVRSLKGGFGNGKSK